MWGGLRMLGAPRPDKQSLLLLRVVDVEPAAELGLGATSWLLQLSLGGEVRSHAPGQQKEFAWEVSQLARRHLDLRVALRRKVLLGLSQFLGETVIPVDGLLEHLRVGAVDAALWYDLVNGPRRRGRVRLSFRLAFSSRDSLDYLGQLHEQVVRVLREGEEDEEGLTESESVTSSHLGRGAAGLAGYEESVARAAASPAAGDAAGATTDAIADEPEAGDFVWVTGPQVAQELRRVQVWAEESYASVRRGGRFGAELARRAMQHPRLSQVFGTAEEAAETGLQLLDLMIGGVRNPAIVQDSFHEASARLERRGMDESAYGWLGHAVIGALRAAEEAQGSWTDRVLFAWRAAFTLAARTLLELARQMRAGLLPPALGSLGAAEQTAAPRRFSFNSRFQTALEKIWSDSRDGAAWVEMAEVAKDFEEAAQMYGRVIVLERFLPDHLKTIKPLCVVLVLVFRLFSKLLVMWAQSAGSNTATAASSLSSPPPTACASPPWRERPKWPGTSSRCFLFCLFVSGSCDCLAGVLVLLPGGDHRAARAPDLLHRLCRVSAGGNVRAPHFVPLARRGHVGRRRHARRLRPAPPAAAAARRASAQSQG